jgi:hypothetical protein
MPASTTCWPRASSKNVFAVPDGPQTLQLVSSRDEHTPLVITGNLPFARRGDVFDEHTIGCAMIDRIVYHADVISLEATGAGSGNFNPPP